MDYKTILVYFDEDAHRAERLALGLRIAGRFGAHVQAIFARPSYVPFYALAQGDATSVLALEKERRASAIREAEGAFRKIAEGFAGVPAEWRVTEFGELADVGRRARTADLVIAAQPEPGDGAQKMFVGDLLLSAGRPVLFVPYAGRFADVGRRVLVAWNDSRESARAVADALPFLRRAERVDLLLFDTAAASLPAESGADVVQQLARHGVKASVRRERVEDVEVGELVLSRTADFGSDLVVMGGYGHSRVRENLFGGVTSAMLRSMTVPVLMSH